MSVSRLAVAPATVNYIRAESKEATIAAGISGAWLLGATRCTLILCIASARASNKHIAASIEGALAAAVAAWA